MDAAIAQQWTSSMSSCLPEGAAHAPLKIEVRGSKPALRGIVPNHPPMVYFPMFWDAVVVGVTHDPHEVGGAQRRSRRLFLTAYRFCFCFQSRGPWRETPSEAPRGGRGRPHAHPEIKNARPSTHTHTSLCPNPISSQSLMSFIFIYFHGTVLLKAVSAGHKTRRTTPRGAPAASRS